MKVTIIATPKEIADLVAEIQSRQKEDEARACILDDIAEKLIDKASSTKSPYSDNHS